jgi:hypothetical protein
MMKMMNGSHNKGDDMLGGLVQKLLGAVMKNFEKVDVNELKMDDVTAFMKKFLIGEKVEDKTVTMIL